MAMKLTNYKNNIFVIAFIVFPCLLCFDLANAMGSGDDLKMDRDSGIIGEKKTIDGEKQYYEESTGITYHTRKRGTFVTPKVIGDTAYLGSYQNDHPTSLGYSFRLACLDWRYNIIAYWSSPAVTEERIGFSVDLISPDKKILINIKELDIPIRGSLATSPTQEQLDAFQLKGYVEDPFIGNERILAAQQAIKWILDNEHDEYNVTEDMPIKFASEQIGNKVFVKVETDIFSKKENVIKKCIIWALNYRGSRLKGEENVRWMETWTCRLISDTSNYSSALDKMYGILETFKFDNGRNVYPDLLK